LGAHSQCASVGELVNLRKFSNPSHRLSATSDFVLNPMFAELQALTEEVWYATLIDRITAEHPGVTLLIDNSKKVDWARRFAMTPGVESRYVHLIRDPRALLRRWTRLYDSNRLRRRQRRELLMRSPKQILKSFFASDQEVLLLKWLRANQEIASFIRSQKQQSPLVTYHDLVTDTSSELDRIMQPLGMRFEPDQMNFGDGRSFGTRKKDYLEMTERSEIRMDCRWRSELPVEVQQMWTSYPAVSRYLESLGLAFSDDGLTRVSR
jgi:hypothetical protein